MLTEDFYKQIRKLQNKNEYWEGLDPSIETNQVKWSEPTELN